MGKSAVALWLTVVACSYIVAQPVLPCGTPIGSYKNVNAYSNGPQTGSVTPCETTPITIVDPAGAQTSPGEDGLQYQCVELVRRFYREAVCSPQRPCRVPPDHWKGQYITTGCGQDGKQSCGDAQDFYPHAALFGLTGFPNPGIIPPSPDDIIGFSTSDGTLGHVAIVKSIDTSPCVGVDSTTFTVQLLEQNTLRPHQLSGQCQRQTNGTYTYTLIPRSIPIQGWLRLPTIPATIKYTFTGVGSGSLGGVQFSGASFTFTVTANSSTTMHTSVDGPNFYNTGPFSYAITGVGTGTSTNPVSVFSGDIGHLFVGVMTGTYPSGNLVWGAVNSLPVYNLTTALGPVNLTDFFRSQPEPLSTSGGVLSMSSISNLTFQATSWLSFTEGNPGVPGDGVFVSANAQNTNSFDLTTPFPLNSVANGITTTVFASPSNPVYEIQFTVGVPFSPIPQCTNARVTTSGFSGGLLQSVVVNGVQGWASNVSQFALQEILGVITQQYPGCNVTFADLYVTTIRVFANVQGQYVNSLDAAAIFLGQNAFPSN